MTVCEHENLTGRGLDNCAEASVTVSSDARVRMWRLQRFLRLTGEQRENLSL